jgi:hypothetical protein
MNDVLTFDRSDLGPHGDAVAVSPLVRRLVAPNGGPFTFTGTCSYLIGQRDLVVIDPGPDPSFEEVKSKYDSFAPTEAPGRDFLFSIATNYPDKPEPEQMATQRVFIKELSEVYPYEPFQAYLSNHPVALENRRAYMKWMYGLLGDLSKKMGFAMPAYNSYSRRVLSFKGGCEKKKFKGKTCRKKMRGGKRKTSRLPLFR